MLSGIGQWFQNMLQNIVDGLGSAFENLVDLLPASPFQVLSNTEVSGFMGWLNWVVPINQMVSIMEAWTVAILAYYIYVVILRWIKAIQ